ncbi:MAG: hypothetical protein WKF43_12535 [Acidimicrobiales bacterium]
MLTSGELVDQGDLDELVRHVDRLCATRDWDALVDLRDRSRRALERGRQLWPVASLAEYRLALLAPGAWSGPMVVEGAGWLAVGPLAEVAASTHPWDELGAHVPDGPLRAVAAHERVIRGDDLDGDRSIDRRVLDIPLSLASWEPAYALATYRDDKAEFPAPRWPGPGDFTEVDLPSPPAPLVRDEAVEHLRSVTSVWATASNGVSRQVAVAGDAVGAVAALLEGAGTVRLAPLDGPDALAWLGWAGPAGRRGPPPGAARGGRRWWLLHGLAGWTTDWPVPADELGAVVDELRWYAWDDGPRRPVGRCAWPSRTRPRAWPGPCPPTTWRLTPHPGLHPARPGGLDAGRTARQGR